MTTTRKKDSSLVSLVRWATDPANRATVLWILGVVCAFLGGGAAQDLRGRLPITQQQLDKAREEITIAARSAQLEVAREAAVQTLKPYQDSLARKERFYLDSIAEPTMATLGMLVQDVQLMKQAVGMANQKIDLLPAPDNATLRSIQFQLQQLQSKTTSDPRMNELLDLVRQHNEEIRALNERINQQQRTTKVKF